MTTKPDKMKNIKNWLKKFDLTVSDVFGIILRTGKRCFRAAAR